LTLMLQLVKQLTQILSFKTDLLLCSKDVRELERTEASFKG
jgi:hypothetical protein